MTPKRKYSLFISSTYEDLAAERQAVLSVALENDFIPIGMEQFGAHPSDKWDLITRMIDDCDAYLLVIGGRYGSVDDQDISWTEREYDYAKSKGLPIIALIRQAEAITADKMDERQEELDKFRSKIKSADPNAGFFTNIDSLKYEAGRGLGNTKEYLQASEGGWVRYSDVQDIINADRKKYSADNAYMIEAMSNALKVMSDKIADLDSRTTWHEIEPISKDEVNKLFE